MSSPRLRAATAGNSAFRSWVEVKMQLTIRSGARSLRADQLPHQLLGRLDDACRGRCSEPWWRPAPPRVGGPRSWRGIFPERGDLPLAEPPRLPPAQIAELERADPDPASGPRPRCRPPRPSGAPGACAPRGSSPRSRARRGAPTSAGAVGPSSSRTPLRSRSRSRVRGRTGQPDTIGLRHAVAGMGQTVGELPVVGQQDQPGRVGVESADRIEPALASRRARSQPGAGPARGRSRPLRPAC